jgi:hypothetical protein
MRRSAQAVRRNITIKNKNSIDRRRRSQRQQTRAGHCDRRAFARSAILPKQH